MPNLPTAILIDLDDTILAAFGKSQGQWERVIGSFADRLAPHRPEAVIEAIQAYSQHLWADQARHKHWRHRIDDARRHIVTNALWHRSDFTEKLRRKISRPDLIEASTRGCRLPLTQTRAA